MTNTTDGGSGVGATPANQPDAYGQAALMLAESILHALVESGVLSNEEAISVVETAQEVREELQNEFRNPDHKTDESLQLLGKIAASLGTDVK